MATLERVSDTQTSTQQDSKAEQACAKLQNEANDQRYLRSQYRTQINLGTECSGSEAHNFPCDYLPKGLTLPSSDELFNLGDVFTNSKFTRLLSDADGRITQGSLADFRSLQQWLRNINLSRNPLDFSEQQQLAVQTLNDSFFMLSGGTDSINPKQLVWKYPREQQQSNFAPDAQPSVQIVQNTVEMQPSVQVVQNATEVQPIEATHLETQSVKQEVHPPEEQGAVSTEAPRKWDPRLDGINVTMETPPHLQPGEKYWRLVGAQYRPEGNDAGSAQGTHHIYYHVLDENGKPLVGASIRQGWDGGTISDQTKPDDNGTGNIAMYGGGKFWPAKNETGPYTAWVDQQGRPSDKVKGLGLVDGAHTSFDLVYQLSRYEATNRPSDAFSASTASADTASAPSTDTSSVEESIAETFVQNPVNNNDPQLNIWSAGRYEELSGIPHYSDDGGPNDPLAPQLASMFGSQHTEFESVGSTPDFPRVTRTLRMYQPGEVDENGNKFLSKDGEVSAFGFATTTGESIYLPKSGYNLDGNHPSVQGKVISVDKVAGQIVVAYHEDTIGDGYNFYVNGIDIPDNLNVGTYIDVENQPLGTARGKEILTSIRDRHTFFDNRFIHHWWRDLGRHS